MSELLARLIADGTSPELVAEVAMVLAEKAVSDRAITERRAKDRERQNRRRSRDVTECHVTACDNTDTPPLSRPPNENISNPPTHTPPDIYPARVKADDFPRLDCASVEVWRDFLKNRKAKRLPCTATAHKRLIADLATWVERTGWPPGKVFEACVAKGWGAIYDPRNTENGRNQTNRENLVTPNGRPMGRTEAAGRAMLARVAGTSECGGNNPSLDALPDNRRALGHVNR